MAHRSSIVSSSHHVRLRLTHSLTGFSCCFCRRLPEHDVQREPAELHRPGERGDVPGEQVQRRPDGVRHQGGHRDGRVRRQDPPQARRRPIASHHVSHIHTLYSESVIVQRSLEVIKPRGGVHRWPWRGGAATRTRHARACWQLDHLWFVGVGIGPRLLVRQWRWPLATGRSNIMLC